MDADDELTRLALAAGRGDRTALSDFIRATQADVWRFAAHMAGSDRADDLTQETFLRMLTALPRFEGRSTARTWLLAIARHAVADLFRHESARPWLRDAVALPPDHPSPHAAPDARLAAEQLVATLEPDRREALLLTQVLGFSYAEVAQICGCPIGTVRSRVARARADLVAELHEGEREPEPLAV